MFRDPDTGSEMQNPDLVSEINTPKYIPESVVTIFWVKNTKILCPGSRILVH